MAQLDAEKHNHGSFEVESRLRAQLVESSEQLGQAELNLAEARGLIEELEEVKLSQQLRVEELGAEVVLLRSRLRRVEQESGRVGATGGSGTTSVPGGVVGTAGIVPSLGEVTLPAVVPTLPEVSGPAPGSVLAYAPPSAVVSAPRGQLVPTVSVPTPLSLPAVSSGVLPFGILSPTGLPLAPVCTSGAMPWPHRRTLPPS